jgi:hypothetical protein
MKNELLIFVIIKAVIAFLFVGAIASQPYNYYQIIKIIALIGFGFLAFVYLVQKNGIEMIIAVFGVAIFNPFFKVHFKKSTWHQIDIVLAIIVGIWCLVDLYRMDLQKRLKRE